MLAHFFMLKEKNKKNLKKCLTKNLTDVIINIESEREVNKI